VPLSTILVVWGAWVVLLALTIWWYRRSAREEDAE
jgi:hypothetical protein